MYGLIYLFLRFTAIGSFFMALYSMTYLTLGYAMIYMLIAIFMQLQAMDIRSAKTQPL